MENTVANPTINIISLFFLFFHFGDTLCSHGAMLIFDRQHRFNISRKLRTTSRLYNLSLRLADLRFAISLKISLSRRAGGLRRSLALSVLQALGSTVALSSLVPLGRLLVCAPLFTWVMNLLNPASFGSGNGAVTCGPV